MRRLALLWSSFALAATLALLGCTSDEPSSQVLANQAAPFTIYAIGDSTMADYDVVVYPNQRGWGQMFPQFIVGEGVSFVNAARNGRSSKSFYVEGLWDAVKARLLPGDYVLIQFAHNDEADAGLEGPEGRGTEAWGAFHDYIAKYVEETRALGANPVLVTPVVRRYFSGTTLTATGTHDLTGNGTAVGDANYVGAMKDVAAASGSPLIDLTASSKALVEQYGPTNSKAIIYVSEDDTHLQPLGATLFAQLAVQEMISKDILASHLNPAADLVLSPTSADFGSRFVATTLDKTFSVTGLSLDPVAGNVTITAPNGFLVSAPSPGAFTESAEIAYSGGQLPPSNFLIRFAPALEQRYAGDVTVRLDNGKPRSVAVMGSGLAAPSGAEETIVYALTSDGRCTSATGFATCAEETLMGAYVRNYQAVGEFGVSQRISILSPTTPDTWSAEVDIDPNRYAEFTVSPIEGKTFTLDRISLYAGGAGGNGMAFRIQYSTQSDFSAPVDLGNYPNNVSNTLSQLEFTPIIVLASAQTFYLRVYPWYKSAASGKYLCLQALTLHGTVQ